jgi:hypothetical protein
MRSVTHQRRTSGAFIHTEVLASIGLTIILAGVLSVGILHYAAVRRENDVRRTLQLMAAAELDCIRAGIRPVPQGQPDHSPISQPGIVVVTATAAPGNGPWAGLTHVRVVASQRVSSARVIAVELAAFVARRTAEEPP